MPEVRERKKSDKIKGKGSEKNSPVKQDRRMDIRQRPADSKGRQATPPVRELAAAPPKPQERMRQKAKAEMQTRRTKAGRISSPTRPDRPPAPAHSAGTSPVSLDNQSINPIKERPRRSFVPKEKPAGGSFIPKTRQQAAAASKSTAKAASTAAKGKKAARPLEMAKRRVQRNAQRKLLRQSTTKAKRMLDLSRKRSRQN